MILDCYKIYDRLFQGPMPPAGDIVAKGGFDVLVLCAWENQDAEAYPGVEVILAPGEDLSNSIADSEELVTWQKTSIVVADRLKAGKKVLVTCMGGYNRSGMVTAMAMKQIVGWSMSDIIDHVRRKRPGALHNHAFVLWLNTQFGNDDDQDVRCSSERSSDLPDARE